MARKWVARGIIWIVLFFAAAFLVSSGKREPAGGLASSPNRKGNPKVGMVTTRIHAVMEQTVAILTGKKALPIVLPRPIYISTPVSFASVPNLEKPRGRARPPFYVPLGTGLVSKAKPVTGSDNEPILGYLNMITDGDKESVEGGYVELGPSKQFVTIDLEAEYEIFAVVAWHLHSMNRVYFDVIGQISTDMDFRNPRTFFNNDRDNSSGLGAGQDKNYIETSEGRLIDAKGVKGRYVRFYSNGNSSNDLNHYIEIEVWGKPLK